MTGRIYFEKFCSEEDFPYYFSLVSDEKVMAMVTERAIPLEEAENNFERLLLKNERHEEFGSYKIYISSTREFIGLAKLDLDEDNPLEAELGYLIRPDYWGKGYGSEAAELIISKAEKLHELRRITAIIDPNNIPSKKILLKNGFISEKLCEFQGLPGEILSKIL
ncbi:GNAT family N-acetyltransferase [Clostridium polynesiense]|uniref:GNAT family N-acetyltransferase n=1 Tax=Clostridium polynesiense TaxID=1325933 RepID=UPI00058E823A|nr:GNAT family N-acetyltransferase [Clostridium polynesiense]